MLHPSQGLKLHSTVGELTSSVVQFHFKSCHAVKISLQILSEIALFFFSSRILMYQSSTLF
jgi:hypothetical protein